MGVFYFFTYTLIRFSFLYNYILKTFYDVVGKILRTLVLIPNSLTLSKKGI
jgi:hypothetical protein